MIIITYQVYVHTAPSGKRYVGITSIEPEKRWGNGKRYSFNKHITNAINKYGWEEISHDILFSCDSEEEAGRLEDYMIKVFRSYDREHGYNIRPGGGRCAPHSEETKRKISMANAGRVFSPEHIEKLRSSHIGIKLSEETKEKMRKARLGRPVSEETKKKIGDANRGRTLPREAVKRSHDKQKKRVYCRELDRYFKCAGDAQNELGIDACNIRSCCLGRLKSAGGYHWEYALERR